MRARSLHRRLVAAPPAEVGALLDTLASADDRLWPHERWPAMAFDRPLAVGAAGGHAFVRYSVAAYEPGSSVEFTIQGPPGFTGSHGFHVHPEENGAVLTHWIEGAASARFVPAWLVVVRPLHDALIADALDKAEAAAAGTAWIPAPFPRRVRILRRIAGRRSPRRGA